MRTIAALFKSLAGDASAAKGGAVFKMLKRVLFIFALGWIVLPTEDRDFSRDFPNELKSRYFIFRYQRAAWDAASFARFADAFVDLVNRDFIKVGFAYPIEVLVLPDRETFQAYLRSEFKVSNPPGFGIYLPHLKLFATYEKSGMGTFAHEIMHPLVERNLPDRPAWAVEAIPSFFEKFYGYYDSTGLKVQWGYQNPWRIHALGVKLASIDLEKLVNAPPPPDGYNQSELRLVSVFLWQQGKLPRFLQLVAARSHAGFPTYFEATMELPMKDIVPLWKSYLNDLVYRRAELLRLPASEVFATRDTFVGFIREHGLTVEADSTPRAAGN